MRMRQLVMAGTITAVSALLTIAGQSAAQQRPSGEASGSMERADAGMRDVLAQLRELGAKPLHELSVEEARANPTPADAVRTLMERRGISPSTGVAKQDFTYRASVGDMPARLYVPTRAPGVGRGNGAALPVILYFHGGGWVIAAIDTYDASARALAEKTGALVLAVTYRQAPEHKFPAAHEDAFAAYRWVLDNAGRFGGDPARVAVAGESAGGNLALNVAIMAREHGLQAPAHMLLVYPVVGVDTSTPSYVDNAEAMPLGRADMLWFFDKVLRRPEDRASPMFDIVGRANLARLPSATIITASIDPLRSEGEALAERIGQAGGTVTLRNFEGVAHEFFGMAPVVADAERAQDLAAAELGRALGLDGGGAATGGGTGSPDGTGDTGGRQPLSERLGETGGVLRPPAGIDPGIRVPAPVPNPGTTPVIPPPPTFVPPSVEPGR